MSRVSSFDFRAERNAAGSIRGIGRNDRQLFRLTRSDVPGTLASEFEEGDEKDDSHFQKSTATAPYANKRRGYAFVSFRRPDQGDAGPFSS
ncbi:hypothetical protein MTO96_042938 [Rhipicephalus appendiculatus]